MKKNTQGGKRNNSGRNRLSWSDKKHSVVLFIKGYDITRITGCKKVTAMKKYIYESLIK